MRGELYDRYGQVLRVFHRDAQDTNKFVIETREDVDAVLRKVQAMKAYREHKDGRLRDMRHLAEVPLTIVEKSMREKWDDATWKRWLNDPDNAALRVQAGRV